VRHAATLIGKTSDGDIRFDQIAQESGFKTIAEFHSAFQSAFGMSAGEYSQQFSQGPGLAGTPAEASEQSRTSARAMTTINAKSLLASTNVR
jgi:AraC-like DNA-binding protein